MQRLVAVDFVLISMDHQHGRNCGCSHDVSTENIGNLYSLYTKIDKEQLECLNEIAENSGRLVFRPWDERLHDTVKLFI